jgi:hypothetical protein
MSFGIVRRLDTDFPEFLTSHHASLRCVACGRAYNAYSNTEKSCCKHTHGIVIANVGEQTVYAYKYVPKPKTLNPKPWTPNPRPLRLLHMCKCGLSLYLFIRVVHGCVCVFVSLCLCVSFDADRKF